MPGSDDDKTIALGSVGKPLPKTRSTIGKTRSISHNALPIGTRLSEFEIVDLVGEGGFGIVYLAEDHSLHRRVAIKEYMPSSLAERGDDASVVVRAERHQDTFEVGRRSFVNEAQLLAQFDHQALLKVYRFWEANGTAYMAMPFYAGKTLRDVLKERSSPPDEQWIRKLLMPIMEALELMHGENCFHRDVAPDNIMILRDERPVLLDFGAARRVISDKAQALTVILKPGFAPIEQYADMPGIKQGPWTDIYALAAVVYFMILSRTPPPSVNRMMQDSYEPLTVVAAGKYSDRLLRVIDQCLAVRAEDRPQAIGELRELLGYSPDPGTTWIEIPAETQIIAAGNEQAQNDRESADTQPSVAAVLEPTIASASPATPPPAAHSSEAPLPPSPAQPAAARRARLGKAHYVGAALGASLLAGVLVQTLSTPPKPPPERVVPAPPAPPQRADNVVDPPVPAAMPSRPPVTLEQALATIATGSDSSFALSASEVHTPLTIDQDALAFTLRSQRGGYLYLLLHDTATARVSLLFPNALDPDNRVDAGKPILFPRATWAYQADQPPGNWQLLAIVSAAPRRFALLQDEIRDGVASSPAQRVEERLNHADAGPTALLGVAECAKEPSCPSDYAAVRLTVEEVTAGSRHPVAAASSEPATSAKAKAAGGTEGTPSPDLNKQLEEMLKAK
ncbi:MAG: serine/threonine-protein kinase [Candidatus Accumulibacter sp.]|uniref:serine/threonine-protein kinase n=1 Tax=Accumulibacter sp. TaxID=2053492 RepID=UPI002878975C|nr:serine/threonine-protein kinase [Accumulibacter sp.]MDS4015081.1 serine/threonine-protein kinase [Accumulibacter sp.]